jgi:hypothetical protein
MSLNTYSTCVLENKYEEKIPFVSGSNGFGERHNRHKHTEDCDRDSDTRTHNSTNRSGQAKCRQREVRARCRVMPPLHACGTVCQYTARQPQLPVYVYMLGDTCARLYRRGMYATSSLPARTHVRHFSPLHYGVLLRPLWLVRLCECRVVRDRAVGVRTR